MATEEIQYRLTFKAIVTVEPMQGSPDSESNTARIESYLSQALLERGSDVWVIVTIIEPSSETEQYHLLFDAVVTVKPEEAPLNSQKGPAIIEADLLMALQERFLHVRAIDTTIYQATYKYEDEHVEHSSPAK